MTKAVKKVLCVFLSLIFLFSSVSAVSFAADFSYSSNYFLKKTDNQSASIVLDAFDKILFENFNINKKVILIGKTILTNEVSVDVDLSSVNGLCKTLDNAKNMLSGATGAVIKSKIGDLANVNLSSWMSNLSRGANDYTIISELIELAAANPQTVGKLLDGSLNTGVVRVSVDPEEYLGSDGMSGFLKKLLVGMVYDKEAESADFNRAYKKALINFDTFIYEDVLREKIRNVLPGFSMDSLESVDKVLQRIFSVVWESYIAPEINKMNIDLSSYDSEGIKNLSKFVVLDGKQISTYLPLDDNKEFSQQINSTVGYIVRQIFPKYSFWAEGSYEMLARNIVSVNYYVAGLLGISTAGKKETEVFFELTKALLPVISQTKLSKYFKGADKCSDLRQTATVILRNYAEARDIAVTDDSDASPDRILGDILASFLSEYISIGYTPGSGPELLTVAENFFNAVFYNGNLKKLFGIKASKSDSIYKKLDELVSSIKLFGEITPDKYKAQTYLTKLIESINNCEFTSLYDLTIKNIFSDFGFKSFAGVFYNALFNFLNNRFSVQVIAPFSTAKPINNAISNQALSTSAVNLLSVLKKDADSVLPGALRLFSIFINNKKIESVKISDQVYYGKNVEPYATVRFNGTVLTQGSDYKISYKNNDKPGTATAVIIGQGSYCGKYKVNFNISMESLTKLSVRTTREGIFAEWIKVPGADRYEVFLGNKLVTVTEDTNVLITDCKGGTQYTVKVRAVSDAAGPTDFCEANIISSPDKIEKLSIKSGYSGLILNWNASKGAKGYEIEQLQDGVWKKLAYVTGTTYTVKNLTKGVTYSFRVSAKGSATDSYSPYSDTVSAIFVPKIESVEKITASCATTMITLYWQSVDGADEYEVYVDNYSAISTSATSAVITKLEPGKQYNVKIRAVNRTIGSSPFTEATVATIPENVGTLTFEKKSDSATVYWKAAKGAEKYDIFVDGIKKGSTKSTSYKISGFKSGKSYIISVCSVNSICGNSTLSYVNIPFAAEKVSKLTASATENKVTLKWPAANGAASYEVEQLSGSKWKKITTTTSLSYTVSGLDSAVKYSFRVRAYSSAGKGAYSPTATVITKPAKVKTLKASSKTDKAVTLCWDKVKNAEGYAVEKKVGNEWKVVKKVMTNKYTVSSLSPYTSYSFRVRAYKEKTYGSYSQTLTVKTLLSGPTNFKAKTVESKKVTLSWGKVSSAKGYDVYVKSGDSWKKVASTTKTSVTISSLKTKTSYKFRVKAYDSKKVSGVYSSTISVKTK